MTKISKRLLGLAAAAGAILAPAAAWATGPEAWGMYLQAPVTGVASDIHSFSILTFWIITPITLFVLALLIIVMVRFNSKANPTPSKTTHNTMIEVVWTVAPILILLILAIPSFRLLYEEQTIPQADVTIKATGVKWHWEYEYPDNNGISFASFMIADADITDPARQKRLLSADNPLVVPVNKVVRVQVTGADVIHAFAMQPFGIKIDAVPGRLNETWFKADAVGTYYGQCSELCGQQHAFMPIEIHVVTDEQYAAWSATAKDDIDAATKLLTAFADENLAAENTKLAAR